MTEMTEMIKIQEQIAQLTAKVEAVRADSIAGKVAMMKALMAAFDITVKDLQDQPESKASKKRDQAALDSFSVTDAPAAVEQKLTIVDVSTSSQINEEKVVRVQKRVHPKVNRKANSGMNAADGEGEKLEKLVTPEPETPTTITAVVEPEKVESQIDTNTSEGVAEFLSKLYKTASDVQRGVDRMTKKQKLWADRQWKKQMYR